MPRAIPLSIRRTIVERHQAGEALTTIAGGLKLSCGTVRHLWQRFRRRGEAGLATDHHRCGRRRSRDTTRMLRAACWLRRHQPSWGADLIIDLFRRR